ncbi:MAG: hypothetical protein LBQ98_03755 [Nitrososphaerota archaeon]|jgi:hypothetical protein|nr:hypothetical protein [Nitrososphaerota archaeon]
MTNNIEEKIKHVLSDPTLSAIKTALEKDHAIECLFMLYIDKGKWKNAQDFTTQNGLTISATTFRARMIEFEKQGLAKSEIIDPLKRYYVKTELGEKAANLMLELFEKIEKQP